MVNEGRVHDRGSIPVDGYETPYQEHGFKQEIERQHPEDTSEQLFSYQYGREYQPIREPPGRDRHCIAIVRPARFLGRPVLWNSQSHLQGGVRGIRKPYDVAQYGRPVTGNNIGSSYDHDPREQFQPVNSAPVFGPSQRNVPRLRGVV